jgi:hypothetical protein
MQEGVELSLRFERRRDWCLVVTRVQHHDQCHVSSQASAYHANSFFFSLALGHEAFKRYLLCVGKLKPFRLKFHPKIRPGYSSLLQSFFSILYLFISLKCYYCHHYTYYIVIISFISLKQMIFYVSYKIHVGCMLLVQCTFYHTL